MIVDVGTKTRAAIAAVCLAGLQACSGGGGDSGAAAGGGTSGGASGPTSLAPADQTAAATFLARASFGGDQQEINNLVGDEPSQWVNSQFNRGTTLFLQDLLVREQAGEDLDRRAGNWLFWDAMITANDQLRQRMVFALSQILVVSESEANNALMMAHYMDILSRNAFGNYRDLLQDITYSPLMAEYLTFLRNRKGDERTGRMPDENYAREILQLFTIGLVELNMDGSVVTNPDGSAVETYNNDDVVGLARVFTGLAPKGAEFWDADPDWEYHDLQAFPEQHSELEKTFLGLTIAERTGPEETINQALDHIFEHPNVPPFVARQLIQRFTASSPQPEYIERVANAFASGSFQSVDGRNFGNGERGDLRATLAAVLLDPSLLTAADDPTHAKVREPILQFAHWARAFDVANVNTENENQLRDTSSPATAFGQHPFRSPSVFNFYRPGYVPPGTEVGERNMTAPEFQIMNEAAAVGYANLMTQFVLDRSNQRVSELETYAPDYRDEIALADDAEALVDHLDQLLTRGRMSDIARQDIVESVNALTIREDQEDEDRLRRVHIAVVMAVNTPAFAILR